MNDEWQVIDGIITNIHYIEKEYRNTNNTKTNINSNEQKDIKFDSSNAYISSMYKTCKNKTHSEIENRIKLDQSIPD